MTVSITVWRNEDGTYDGNINEKQFSEAPYFDMRGMIDEYLNNYFHPESE